MPRARWRPSPAATIPTARDAVCRPRPSEPGRVVVLHLAERPAPLERLVQQVGLDARGEQRAGPLEDRRDREPGRLAGLGRSHDHDRVAGLGRQQPPGVGPEHDAVAGRPRHSQRPQVARAAPSPPGLTPHGDGNRSGGPVPARRDLSAGRPDARSPAARRRRASRSATRHSDDGDDDEPGVGEHRAREGCGEPTAARPATALVGCASSRASRTGASPTGTSRQRPVVNERQQAAGEPDEPGQRRGQRPRPTSASRSRS